MKGVIFILKAVGQSIKAWILTHKKLYFFIIGFIAFLSFMIITLIGFGKISKAATDSVWFSVDGNSIPDITSLDWSGYTEYFEREYGYTGNIGEKILRDHKYCVVVINPYYWPNEVPWISFLFTNTPYVYEANDLNCIFADFDTSFSFEYRDGQIQYPRGYGMNAWDSSKFPDYPDNSIPFVVISNNQSSQVIASSYDLGDELYCHPSYVSVSYPKMTVFSVDAPYFTFSNLYLYNPILSGDTGILGSGSAFSDFWEAFTKNSLWRYRGQMQKVDLQKDDSYALSLNITIELPTWEYLEEQYMSFGVDLNDAWEHSILKYAPEVYQKWINDSKAPTHTFVITDYQFPSLDANNIFSFQYTFEELLAYIRYFNDDAKTLFSGYDNNALGLHLAFMHFDIMVGNVRTTQEKELVYGRPTTNDFDRGIYGVCLEVTPEVDINTMTPEEMDKVLEDAFKEAHDKYVSDLESEVGRLDEEIQNIQSIGGAFDDLGASDVWNGFVSVVKGFASMGPAIGQLSTLAGSVFAFFPIQVSGFMAFTMLTICIVAIIKAIRG